jgi:peptidoglycan/LPS O-acetylase OafA/YrhL
LDKRIPSLDGIRAVAIFLVILLQLGQHYGWPPDGTLAHQLLVDRAGAIWSGDGVGIFFVLSGFLITPLLVREFNKSGRISIRSFYIRRAVRILPPFVVYLAFAFCFCLYEHIPFVPQNFTSALFFYRDYFFVNDLWLTQHTWSLSVEEQFYLLWPVILLLALRYRGRSAAAKVTAGLILLTPLLRVVSGRVMPSLAHEELYMLHSRMDALMSGCLVALCVGLPKFEAVYQKIAKFWWLLPLEFWGISIVLCDLFGIIYRKSIGLTVDSIVVAFFILWATRNADHWLGRILNSRLLVQAGIMSYSAYLWQTFFLHEGNNTWAGQFPFSLLYIWIAAWASYNLVEKSALRLRDRLMQRRPARHLEPSIEKEPAAV